MAVVPQNGILVEESKADKFTIDFNGHQETCFKSLAEWLWPMFSNSQSSLEFQVGNPPLGKVEDVAQTPEYTLCMFALRKGAHIPLDSECTRVVVEAGRYEGTLLLSCPIRRFWYVSHLHLWTGSMISSRIHVNWLTTWKYLDCVKSVVTLIPAFEKQLKSRSCTKNSTWQSCSHRFHSPREGVLWLPAP